MLQSERANGQAGVAMKQRAYDELKRRIVYGELPPGSMLSLRQLAAELEMSKTPVHSAIERLEANGFVSLAPQQGVVVLDASAEDIVHQFQMRQALEPFVVRRLADTISAEQIERVTENVAEHARVVAARDLDATIRVDVEFHQLLCAFFGNTEITRAMSLLQDKVHRAIYRLLKQHPARAAQSCEEHRAMVKALSDGNGELASSLVHEHLENGLKRFWHHRSK